MADQGERCKRNRNQGAEREEGLAQENEPLAVLLVVRLVRVVQNAIVVVAALAQTHTAPCC